MINDDKKNLNKKKSENNYLLICNFKSLCNFFAQMQWNEFIKNCGPHFTKHPEIWR